MSRIAFHVAKAILFVRLTPAPPSHVAAGTVAAGSSHGGLGTLVLLTGMVLVLALAGMIRRAAVVVSTLIQMAAAMGTAFLAMILVTVVIVVVLLHL